MRKYQLKQEDAPAAASGALWMGIDAHRSSLSVTVLDERGEVVLRAKLQHRRAEVSGLCRRLRGRVTAVYEAGPTGPRLLRWLRAEGCDAFMTPPSLVPTASGDRVKTDKKDSLKLATLLRGGQLKRIHDLSDAEYADRQLVRTRQQAVAARGDVMRQIKSLLLAHGQDIPEDVGDGWGEKMMAWLTSLRTGHTPLNLALAEDLRRLRQDDETVRRLDKAVAQLAKEARYAPRVALLETIPGIGQLSAITLLVEMQDVVRRFDDGSKVASYLGLTPSEFSTGETVRRGRITRQGNARGRTVLVESSWTLVNHDEGMRVRFEALARQRGKKRAIVAIARRLATIIFAMLRDGTPYRVTTKTEDSKT